MSTKKRILLTSGRAPITLDLARLAHAQGHQVFVAETSPLHLCRFSRAVAASFVIPPPRENSRKFADALIAQIQQNGIDLFVPTCEEVFAIGRHRERIARHCEVLCPSLEELEPLHNKARFIELLQEHGLAYPETVKVQSAQEAERARKKWTTCVLKPVYSRFAREVTILKREDALPLLDMQPERPWVAQEYVAGRRLCSYSVASQGKLLAHAVYPVDYSFGTIGSALAFRAIQHPAVRQYVESFTEALDYSGQISFDFIERPDGSVVAIECNPRATSGVHLFGPEDGLLSALIDKKEGCEPKIGREKQLFLPLALFGWGQASWRQYLRTLASARDVLFSWKDPLPALLSPLILLYYAYLALRTGSSITAASTEDLEWNGEACE